MNIDPVTIEVVASRLREAASTMEHALYHSGYSPILRESKDGTSGLTDKDGRVVILSGGIQFHYTAYEQSVQAMLARYPVDALRPGDSFVCNDPYKCGMPHASDYCAITPAFHRGELIGFGVSLAHKSDIGGIVPGSAGAAAREIYHDGVILPPVRFQTERGSRNRSRRSSPTTAALPRSCSAICGRRSARLASATRSSPRSATNTGTRPCSR